MDDRGRRSDWLRRGRRIRLPHGLWLRCLRRAFGSGGSGLGHRLENEVSEILPEELDFIDELSLAFLQLKDHAEQITDESVKDHRLKVPIAVEKDQRHAKSREQYRQESLPEEGNATNRVTGIIKLYLVLWRSQVNSRHSSGIIWPVV